MVCDGTPSIGAAGQILGMAGRQIACLGTLDPFGSGTVDNMDRSIHRFLCLPIFDETFGVILKDLRLDHVEFWIAMSDDPLVAVDERISSFLPALTDDTDIIDKVLVRLDMANLLADMVSRSAN